jgi:hypothetical protein
VAKKVVIATNKNLDSRIPNGNVFSSPLSASAFDMGTFKLTANHTPSKPLILDDRVKKEYSMVTLDDLKYRSIQEATVDKKVNTTLNLNLDKKNLNNYAYFGSLKETLTTCITNIVKNWVGSIFIDKYDIQNGGDITTVSDYLYNEHENVTTFKVPYYVVSNKFEINLLSDKTGDDSIKNLALNFNEYVVDFNGREYPIIEFSGSTTYLYFKVSGKPFFENELLLSNFRYATQVSFHVKPNERIYRLFHNSLSTLEKYLLSTNTEPNYTAVFKLPHEDENGNIIMTDTSLTWPVTDGYNIDIDGYRYKEYLEDLLYIGSVYDEMKTNLLIRELTPRVVFDLDMTDSKKMEKLLVIYGKKFDEIKMFIDGLVHVNRVNYDKTETAPDALIKNLAATLGWDVVSFTSETELFDRLFTTAANYENSSMTPAEIDIEMWRRIVINTSYFFRTKGTRQAIEAVFAMIGVPHSLIEFNEHVYIAEDKIVVLEEDEIYGETGYPFPNQNMHFQQLDSEDNDRNVYMEEYWNRGFSIIKHTDNKKAAIETNPLLINTKEASLNINTAKPLEYDIYKSSVFGMSFIQYLDHIYSTKVGIEDRKVIYDHLTLSYPTLFEVLLDYYKLTGDKITFRKVLRYAIKFSGMWFKFLNQFIPATTIITEGGLAIRNTAFTPQKFVYKTQKEDFNNGIPMGSLGSEFITKQVAPIEQQIMMMNFSGIYSEPIEGSTNTSTTAEGEANRSDSDTISTEGYTVASGNETYKTSMSGTGSEVTMPTMTLESVVKITQGSLSGKTDDIFIKDLDFNKPFTFRFNSTDNLIRFGYTLHRYNMKDNYFVSTPVFGEEFKAYNVVGNMFKVLVPEDKIEADIHYLIKAYMVVDYNGREVTTKDDLSQDSSHYKPYRIYRKETDYYFPSVGVAQKPYTKFEILGATPASRTEEIFNTSNLEKPTENMYKIVLNDEIREGDVIIKLNGTLLTKGIDYLLSPEDEKVILIKDAIRKIGDLNVSYIVDNDANTTIYDIPYSQSKFEWSIVEPMHEKEKGLFTIEISNETDVDFNNPLMTVPVQYQPYTYDYSVDMIFSSVAGIEQNKVYRGRIVSNKEMDALTQDKVTSTMYSDFFKIRLV